MRRVILVTRQYTELANPAGLCTAALADLYATLDWRVRVICAASTAPRPRHETDGQIDVQRIGVKRGAPEHSFSLHAARRVHELASAAPQHLVACIDTPASLIAIASLRRLVPTITNSIGVLADVVTDAHARPTPATDVADARILLADTRPTTHARDHVIPCPISPHTWEGPHTPTPAFIVPEPQSADEHAALVHAFHASGAEAHTWSIAIMTSRGRWTVLPARHADQSATHRHTDVVISKGTNEPIAALINTARGGLCLAEANSAMARRLPPGARDLVYEHPRDLTASMGRIAAMTPEELAARARELHAPLLTRHDRCAIADAHTRLMDTPPNTPPIESRRAMWKAAERGAAALATTTEIAHQ